MKIVNYNGIRILYYDKADIVTSVDKKVDYIIAETDSEDTERISALISNGFTFHNRTVLAEINPFKTDNRLFCMIRYDVKNDTEYSEDMLTIAKSSFVKDRRFHLETHFEQEGASKIIKGYIDEFKQQRNMILKCYYKGQLVGFIVLREVSAGIYENMMGVVAPRYQSRGVSVSLYIYMIKYLREAGCKKLYGRISSSNMTSINLHIALGASFSRPQDTYILRHNI